MQLSSSMKQVNIIMKLCLMAKKIGVFFFIFILSLLFLSNIFVNSMHSDFFHICFSSLSFISLAFSSTSGFSELDLSLVISTCERI